MTENLHLLPRGHVLDIAMGQGRHALYLARHGFSVTGVDRSPTAVSQVNREARALGLPCTALPADLETYSLPAQAFECVLVFYYLQRSLFAPLMNALRPGGVLVYETFTLGQLRYRRHRSQHLLAPGELKEAFSGLEILKYRETDRPELRKSVASLVARKPG